MCLWPRPHRRQRSYSFFFIKLKELCCTHTQTHTKSHKNMTLMPCQFFTRIISEDIFIFFCSLLFVRYCCYCCCCGYCFCCTHSMQQNASILWNRIIAIRYWNYFVLFLSFCFKWILIVFVRIGRHHYRHHRQIAIKRTRCI